MSKIKSIEKGWGEGSTFFSTYIKVGESYKVSEIKEEWKIITIDGHNSSILVYRGYRDGNLYFEIEANSQLTIIYE